MRNVELGTPGARDLVVIHHLKMEVQNVKELPLKPERVWICALVGHVDVCCQYLILKSNIASSKLACKAMLHNLLLRCKNVQLFIYFNYC